MKRMAKVLARLYPAEWRERYGDEFDTLIEERTLRLRDAFDVLWAALKMQMADRRFVMTVAPCAALGMAIALALSVHPARFTSTAVLWVVSDPAIGACGPQQDLPPALRGATRRACDDPTVGTGAVLRAWTQNATDRPFLGSLIQTMNLYPGEQRTTSLDRLVDRMQRDISILPRKPGLTSQQFELRFSYPDPRVAQQVAAKILAHGFEPRRIKLWAPQIPRLSPRHQVSVGLDTAPSLPDKPTGPGRLELGLMGLFCGLLCGVALVAAMNALAIRRLG